MLTSDELLVEERVIKHDLGEVLLKLEDFLEKRQKAAEVSAKRELTDEEKSEALELLRAPQLLERILEDFEHCGVVGERTNKLLGYLAATSRKLAEPLAVVIQSSSAAGKSSLMDAVLELMPEEERVQYSAMTGQSLFYMGETNLQHKILAIVEEQGAERASFALKLLQSEGELTIASTGKDPATGRLVTQEYRVEGPMMIFQTTTAVDMDEELLNRCIVLTVDEGREQTKAIHERQRRARTLAGVVARQERQRILALHQNAQRLIRPLFVVNPYAAELRFPDHQTRMRRDHEVFGADRGGGAAPPVPTAGEDGGASGAEAPVHRGDEQDIEVANRLAHEVLGRSLDELPPQFHFRRADGRPLTFQTQHKRLVQVRGYFKWLTRQNVLLWNPASELELPKLERRLPRHVLTETEAEKVMLQPDTTEPMGVRDRAILEVFYSTGIRRMELVNLRVFDLDGERGTLIVRQGKGKKDRTVPVGERAALWVDKYLLEVRPELVVAPDEGILFLNEAGHELPANRLTQLVREYVAAANTGKKGACHLFRHTMATVMLENGADIRYIQEMLGHVELSTTQIHTQVSIRQLKAVHALTHPSAKLERRPATPGPELAKTASTREELFSLLAAEAEEERLAEDGT